jgi:hypothetical protein
MNDEDGMLFVAPCTHTPDNCPGRSKDGATMLNEFWAKGDLAAKKGRKILRVVDDLSSCLIDNGRPW